MIINDLDGYYIVFDTKNWSKRIHDASIYNIKKNIAQVFILERYFFVSIYPATIPGTYLMVFLVAAQLLCLLHQIYIQRS